MSDFADTNPTLTFPEAVALLAFGDATDVGGPSIIGSRWGSAQNKIRLAAEGIPNDAQKTAHEKIVLADDPIWRADQRRRARKRGAKQEEIDAFERGYVPEWTEAEARGLAIADEVREEKDNRINQAKWCLEARAAQGRVKAFGKRVSDGSIAPIDPASFAIGTLHSDGAEGILCERADHSQEMGATIWSSVTFDTVSVMATMNSLASDNTGASSAPPIIQGTKALPKRAPASVFEQAKAWFQCEFIPYAEHYGTTLNREEIAEVLRKKFPSVTFNRDKQERVIAGLAPLPWRAKGPRKAKKSKSGG